MQESTSLIAMALFVFELPGQENRVCIYGCFIGGDSSGQASDHFTVSAVEIAWAFAYQKASGSILNYM